MEDLHGRRKTLLGKVAGNPASENEIIAKLVISIRKKSYWNRSCSTKKTENAICKIEFLKHGNQLAFSNEIFAPS